MEFGKDDLFISPQGNDSWSGKLPEPNADETDGPLKTLAGARDLIRYKRGLVKRRDVPPVTAGIGGPITVWLRGGRYPVSAPIVFEPMDSAPVTYAAYPSETPVIDGGKRITDWKQETINGVDVWVAELPAVASGEWYFRQLFVNGERRQRPRLPNTTTMVSSV